MSVAAGGSGALVWAMGQICSFANISLSGVLGHFGRRVCLWAVGVARSRGKCVPGRRRRRAAGAGRRDDVGSE